jgi:hypothetical protein
VGALLNCSHIYNQYLFIEDSAKTLKKLEAKKLRLQSLSAYSRENAIGRDATQEFLHEAISQQRLPVKAHFNILAWTDDKAQLKDVKNKVSSALPSPGCAAQTGNGWRTADLVGRFARQQRKLPDERHF